MKPNEAPENDKTRKAPAHDGFGLKPRLKIGFIDRSGLYIYFLFSFWRFEIYRCRVKKVTDNDRRSI